MTPKLRRSIEGEPPNPRDRVVHDLIETHSNILNCGHPRTGGGNIRPVGHIWPAKTNFLVLNTPFWLKFGPRDTNKGAKWPAGENSCSPPTLEPYNGPLPWVVKVPCSKCWINLPWLGNQSSCFLWKRMYEHRTSSSKSRWHFWRSEECSFPPNLTLKGKCCKKNVFSQSKDASHCVKHLSKDNSSTKNSHLFDKLSYQRCPHISASF